MPAISSFPRNFVSLEKIEADLLADLRYHLDKEGPQQSPGFLVADSQADHAGLAAGVKLPPSVLSQKFVSKIFRHFR